MVTKKLKTAFSLSFIVLCVLGVLVLITIPCCCFRKGFRFIVYRVFVLVLFVIVCNFVFVSCRFANDNVSAACLRDCFLLYSFECGRPNIIKKQQIYTSATTSHRDNNDNTTPTDCKHTKQNKQPTNRITTRHFSDCAKWNTLNANASLPKLSGNFLPRKRCQSLDACRRPHCGRGAPVAHRCV